MKLQDDIKSARETVVNLHSLEPDTHKSETLYQAFLMLTRAIHLLDEYERSVWSDYRE